MTINVMVNFWAVLVSAVAAMAIGSVWYGPLFGKLYISLTGLDKKTPEEQAVMKKRMVWTYVWQFLANIVTFYVLAWLTGALGLTGAMGGIQAAFWVWLGFVLPEKFGSELWGGSMKLFAIGVTGSLLTLLAGGAIIGAW